MIEHPDAPRLQGADDVSPAVASCGEEAVGDEPVGALGIDRGAVGPERADQPLCGATFLGAAHDVRIVGQREPPHLDHAMVPGGPEVQQLEQDAPRHIQGRRVVAEREHVVQLAVGELTSW